MSIEGLEYIRDTARSLGKKAEGFDVLVYIFGMAELEAAKLIAKSREKIAAPERRQSAA